MNKLPQKFFLSFLCLAIMLVRVGVRPAYAASITATTTADENNSGAYCSLREAITAANTNAAYGGCIPLGLEIDLPSGTYTLTIPERSDPHPQSGWNNKDHCRHARDLAGIRQTHQLFRIDGSAQGTALH